MKGFFLLMRSCLAHHLGKSYASSLTARAAPTAKQRPLQSRDVHGNQLSGPWLNPGDWKGYLERKRYLFFQHEQLRLQSSGLCKAEMFMEINRQAHGSTQAIGKDIWRGKDTCLCLKRVMHLHEWLRLQISRCSCRDSWILQDFCLCDS